MEGSVKEELRKYLLIHLGLNFTERRDDELYKKISASAIEFKFANADVFINWMLKTVLNQHQLEKLASFLTIGETYFLREIKALDYLELVYLPELIRKRQGKNQNIRIWSAGCASGEEPYSIAILLKKVIPNIKKWNITILATDINAKFLEKARTGIYTKWSFRKLPEAFKKEHFIEIEKDKFQIKPDIQNMVSFAYQNLATDTYPTLVNNTNAMDIILCRNVLIYFSDKGINQVTQRMYNSLVKGGVFLVSPVEMSSLIFSKFGRIPYQGFTIYTKGPDKKDHKVIPEWKMPETISIKDNFTVLPEAAIYKTILKPEVFEIEKPIPEKEDIKQPHKEEQPGYELALTLFNQGKFEETETILRDALSDDSNISHAMLFLLIKTEANLGRLESALNLCNKALETNKLDAGLYYLMANIQQELGDDNGAVLALNRAIYIAPDFSLAHFALGNLSLKQGEKSLGIKHYRNTLSILSKLNPDEMIPESDGLTAGRLLEIVKTI